MGTMALWSFIHCGLDFFHELVRLYFVLLVTSPSLRGLLLLYVGE